MPAAEQLSGVTSVAFVTLNEQLSQCLLQYIQMLLDTLLPGQSVLFLEKLMARSIYLSYLIKVFFSWKT